MFIRFFGRNVYLNKKFGLFLNFRNSHLLTVFLSIPLKNSLDLIAMVMTVRVQLMWWKTWFPANLCTFLLDLCFSINLLDIMLSQITLVLFFSEMRKLFSILHTILPIILMVKANLGKCQSYTYQVLQTIQMKLILLCVWAEPAVLGSAKTALKLIYKI